MEGNSTTADPATTVKTEVKSQSDNVRQVKHLLKETSQNIKNLQSFTKCFPEDGQEEFYDGIQMYANHLKKLEQGASDFEDVEIPLELLAELDSFSSVEAHDVKIKQAYEDEYASITGKLSALESLRKQLDQKLQNFGQQQQQQKSNTATGSQ
eukprot:CAMPEP_0115026282 /NCGR_PEP_ID=MMETSP0216-20121206/34630_1 /TAXON_ID=223996 /ORGANISM="Protocruzia adherens, Strain Boccale" /LENGTH=152 /DNA_ID=CAMNT_0002401281 /DNA_START=11 /DNA_END=469 /DNA_ORIENTATION=+